MFSDLEIKSIYRTRKDDFEKDFIIPLLKESTLYYRGAGYFNIKSLINISCGLIPFIKNGGSLKLVTSIELNFEEIKLLANSHELSRNRILEEINKEIDYELSNEIDFLNMDLITNLIAANRIQIKIAYLPDGGLYHEKIGYLEDSYNNKICFIGSNNETEAASRRNAETISVTKSWENSENVVYDEKLYFESLWDNKDEHIEVYNFPEAAINKLFSKYKKSESYQEAILKIENYYKKLITPEKKELYPYQKEAVEKFCSNKYCHFFEMATGTGKTFTAIKSIEAMSSHMGGRSLFVSVVVPQIDLQNQWKEEFDNIGIKNYCFGGNSTSNNYESDLCNITNDYHMGKEKIVVAICTYDTFFSKIIDSIKDLHNMNKLLIVDEAHELSANQIPKLTDDFKFRLGLSATPERHSLEETEKIINYFTRGNVETFKYSIDKAIKNGFLSKYEYHPIIVYMEDNENEFGRYKKYTKKIATLLNMKEKDMKKIQELCNNRSLIVKKASNKIEKIKEMAIDPKYNFKNSVVYCGQGKDLETEESIIDNVSKILHSVGNYSVSHFTSKTENRIEVLNRFENNYYDTLIAIRCFDQGVDVPKLDKIYIMASDGNTRQTIQRRGRVLRKCKETGKKMAYIYDMVTLPPIGIYDGIGATSLVAKELKRVKEYGRLAENLNEVDEIINQIINDYNITEDSDDEKELKY